jgi:hypothetical protein
MLRCKISAGEAPVNASFAGGIVARSAIDSAANYINYLNNKPAEA